MEQEQLKDITIEEPSPLLPSWNAWYVVVLLNLSVLIALLYLFTRAFD